MTNPKISLVVPCFNEEDALPIFYEKANEVLNTMGLSGKAEFVFVDDGSKDNTLKILKELVEKDKSVHYLSFSRNFGKEAALFAGLHKAQGDYIAVMDADLQDPPSLLPEMLEAIEKEGYDCAATRRSTRKNEPVIRSWFARKFYKVMRKMSNVPVVDGARDFRLMTKKYKEAVLSLDERNRFTKGIFPWVGFNTKWFEYENVERVAGKSKWSFWKLFVYSIDGIVGFSTKPLYLSAFIGIFAIILAFISILFLIIRKLLYGDPVQGWASSVCIIIFLGGIQLFTIGIMGIYMAKIYTEVKNRPLYIIREEA